MTGHYPYDIRRIDLPSETDMLRHLRECYYADESRSYLAWLNPDLCNSIRRFIASSCAVPLSSVILVGSGRLGFSTKNGLPFEMGFSDLDIAVVSPSVANSLHGKHREVGGQAAGLLIRPDHHPGHPFCAAALKAAKKASQLWSDEFSAVSIAIYPSMDTVAMRTAAALRSWRQLSHASTEIEAPVTYQLQGSRLADIARSGFPMFYGNVDDSSPLISGPYVVSYDEIRTVIGAMGSRDQLLRSLNTLLDELKNYVTIETLMIGGSVLIPEVATPRDIDCFLFYSAMNGGAHGVGVDKAMKWVRKYRQKGVDMRLFPVDGPGWLTVKLAGYSAGLFSASRTGRAQGPVIVAFK